MSDQTAWHAEDRVAAIGPEWGSLHPDNYPPEISELDHWISSGLLSPQTQESAQAMVKRMGELYSIEQAN